MPDTFTQALEEHTKEDHAFQEETRAFNNEMSVFKAESEGSFAGIHTKLDTFPSKDDISNIVAGAMTDYFENKGKLAFRLTVGGSVLIASLTVILGGMKAVLGWIGFHLIR
jgi:hypothetical protein